jgi:hypothetical protein
LLAKTRILGEKGEKIKVKDITSQQKKNRENYIK